MKKKFFLAIAIVFAGCFAANAQGYQQMSMEDRVKMVMEKLNTGLNLTPAQQPLTDSAFTNYYRAMQKLREGLPQGERPDQAEMQKLRAARDENLKKIFTDEQYKKFKDEVEATLRPQRSNNGGGGSK
jgi:periplasmic protein CpxP/Spy